MNFFWFRLWHGVRGHHTSITTRRVLGHRVKALRCSNCDAEQRDW